MLPDLAVPGPSAERLKVSGWSPCRRNGTCLRFRVMSVVSSTTPGMAVNSCSTRSILRAEIAAPSMDDSRILRSALPMVVPNPRSKGWAVKRPNLAVKVSLSTSRRLGFWNPFHCIRILLGAPAAAPRLLRVQLHDELLLDRHGDVLAGRLLLDRAPEALRIELQPSRHAAPLGGVEAHADRLVLAALFPERDDAPRPNRGRRNVDLASVDPDVPVRDELPRHGPRRGEPQAVDDVVETQLQHLQEIRPRDAPSTRGLREVFAELALQHAVHPLDLLLLAKLDAVGLDLRASPAVLTGSVAAALEGALLLEAAVPLQEQLHAFPAAQPANRTRVSRHSRPPRLRLGVAWGGDIRCAESASRP